MEGLQTTVATLQGLLLRCRHWVSGLSARPPLFLSPTRQLCQGALGPLNFQPPETIALEGRKGMTVAGVDLSDQHGLSLLLFLASVSFTNPFPPRPVKPGPRFSLFTAHSTQSKPSPDPSGPDPGLLTLQVPAQASS